MAAPIARRATTTAAGGGHVAAIIPVPVAGAGRGAAGLADLAEHAVFHPVRIPPLDRIHLDAADQHREVQMVATGQPGGAGAAQRLALLDRVASFTSIDDRWA